MRVTAGKFRGRTLAAPADARVRPTSDKVRQAIFNILAHNDFGTGFTLHGVRVIDLFAGTGAMGIEALSRGASYCLFVDNDAESRALIRENVEALELTGVSKVWRRDVAHLGERRRDLPFGFAILDPPYRKNLVLPSLEGLRRGNWLSPNTVVVCETAEEEAIAAPARFTKWRERVYGDTRVTILCFV
jgi:16S rRNA (guanine966-N2)-methyltransferase